MTGIDDDRGLVVQVDPYDLARHEPSRRGVRRQLVVGADDLRAQVHPRPPGVAERTDEDRGEHRRFHVVTRGVGDRQVQGAAIEHVVERVAADGAGRFEPACEGELPRLAREGGGQEPSLNLGGERQGSGALPPFEKIRLHRSRWSYY